MQEQTGLPEWTRFGDEPGRVDTERAGQPQQHSQGWAT